MSPVLPYLPELDTSAPPFEQSALLLLHQSTQRSMCSAVYSALNCRSLAFARGVTLLQTMQYNCHYSCIIAPVQHCSPLVTPANLFAAISTLGTKCHVPLKAWAGVCELRTSVPVALLCLFLPAKILVLIVATFVLELLSWRVRRRLAS
jgi:hypothetical protein